MKKLSFLFFISIIAVCYAQTPNDTHLKLWYNHPAKKWTDALPVGNGRLGAMVYGNPVNENIQLNEITVWGGQPNRNDNPEAKQSLPEVRKLIFDGKYEEAQNLVNKKIISKISQGMPYQTVGNLHLVFPGHENYSGYYRELDIEKAISTTRYTVDGVKYESKVFASFQDQVIIVRITADKPNAVSFAASMSRPAKVDIATKGNDELVMSGITGDCDSVKGAVKFQAQVKIVADGGSIKAVDTLLSVTNANAATLYISIASSFKNYHDISGNPAEKASIYLHKAVKKNFEKILSDNIAAYQKYFNRVSIDFGITDSVKNPTDVQHCAFCKRQRSAISSIVFSGTAVIF